MKIKFRPIENLDSIKVFDGMDSFKEYLEVNYLHQFNGTIDLSSDIPEWKFVFIKNCRDYCVIGMWK